MASNGVPPFTCVSVLIKRDACQREAIDDLAVCLQRQIRAEDVLNTATEGLAVLVVEGDIQAGHGYCC